jgi:hypothetical protein
MSTSDPTELYFCVSIGYFTNARKAALQELIGEKANFVPLMVWAWCAINMRSGKGFNEMTDEQWRQIFLFNGQDFNRRELRKVVAALKKVGFITRDGHVHSWSKYNKFFSHNRFRKAARVRWKQQRIAEREHMRDRLAELEKKDRHNGDPSETAEPSRQERTTAGRTVATNGHGSKSKSPLFRQIESAEKLLADVEAKLKTLPVPHRLIDPDGYEAVCKKRNPLVEEKQALKEQITKLRKEEAGI